MKRNEISQKILESGIMAIIRLNQDKHVYPIVQAITAGGIKALEITLNTPNALSHINSLRESLGNEFTVGAGTVTSGRECQAALDAGAQFIVTPVMNLEIISISHAAEAPVFMGAMTPTEIFTAHQAGADVIKVFPAHILGMDYFKAIAGPLPHIPLMPTGGVSVQNAADWIGKGAKALGVGGGLLDKKAISTEDYVSLTKTAQDMLEQVSIARNA